MLVGLTEKDAIEACEAAGFEYKIYTAESDTVDKGKISSQQIPAGVNVKIGSTIVFTVSTGIKMVNVPSLLSITYEDAIMRLETAGLRYKIVYEDDGRVPYGCVFKQSHKTGSSVAKGTEITIYVSNHEETVTTAQQTERTTVVAKKSQNAVTKVSVNITTTAVATTQVSAKPELILSISERALELNNGDICDLTVTANGSHNVNVASNNSEVADAVLIGSWNGNKKTLRVYAEGVGTATIKIYFDNNPDDYKTCKVTVKEDVQLLTNLSSVETTEGKNSSLVVYCNEWQNVEYKIEDSSIATVKAGEWNDFYCTLTISGLKEGTTTLKISVPDTSASKTVTIKVDENNDNKQSPIIETDEKQEKEISTIHMSDVRVRKGEELKLIPNITPVTATQKELTWSVDDTSIAKIDSDGKLTAVSIGETYATITAKSNDDVHCTFKIIVNN